jgi:hypothetical protein
MAQEEIIRMAREAGFEVVDGQLRLYFDGSKALLKPNYMGTVVDGLKEFATIVATHEREACAKVCEDMGNTEANMNKTWRNGCSDAAAAIRARGEK